MFKKLLSNLPFNPSLIHQVSFYAKRIHRESSIRKSGFVLMALAMVVQLFAVLSPPQSSVQASPGNDIIEGGFSSRDQAVLMCLDGNRDFGKILDHYGITCGDIGSAATVTLHSTDYDRKLYSMGRKPYGHQGEQAVNIEGAEGGRVWLRYLWSWDSAGPSRYQALSGTTKQGLRFFILYSCGNLVFIGVPKPPEKCQWNPTLPANDPKCYEPCPVPGKQHLPKTSPQCFEPCPYNPSIPANSPKCFDPCPYNNQIPKSSPQCKPCKESETISDKTACLVLKKAATNVTQNIQNANNTTAKPGDTIRYTLTVSNTGKATVPKFVMQENMSDILDYADIVDSQGGKLNKLGLLTWPAQDIAPKKSISKVITVKVKQPLPDTPVSSSDPGHFDMTMTNVFGNTITINLPPSVTKKTELVAQTLPNTGPGTGLLVGFGLTSIVGYFFARSRLLATELDVVRKEFASSGGY